MLRLYLNKLLSMVFLVWGGIMIGINLAGLYPNPDYEAAWWRIGVFTILIVWALLNVYVNYKVGPK